MQDNEYRENIEEIVRHLLDLLAYKNREIAELQANNPPPGMREQYALLQKRLADIETAQTSRKADR